MQVWPVQDAKARFSELLETCIKDGPQLVTKRGAEAAVLVPVEQWTRLQQAAKPSLKELLMTVTPTAELIIPPRGNQRRRAPAAL